MPLELGKCYTFPYSGHSKAHLDQPPMGDSPVTVFRKCKDFAVLCTVPRVQSHRDRSWVSFKPLNTCKVLDKLLQP